MPSARQLVDLGEQRLRIDDHAVADDAGDAGCRMPDGMRCSTNFAPPTYTVCPALWPP